MRVRKPKGKSIKANILEMLEVYPHLAENYNALCGVYWYMFDNARSVLELSKVTPAETITRHVRKLVSEGLIDIPERVKLARMEKEMEFRTEFSPLS